MKCKIILLFLALFILFIDKSSHAITKYDYSNQRFTGKASFRETFFDSAANYTGARFLKDADFRETVFKKEADFVAARFMDSTCFRDAQFLKSANFSDARFIEKADFQESIFHSSAEFRDVVFESEANFALASINKQAQFDRSHFRGPVLFSYSRFDSALSFGYSSFAEKAHFRGAQLEECVDFREASFIKDAIVDFTSAQIRNDVLLGSSRADDIQKYDFRLAVLFNDANIILYHPVDILMQHEKIRYIKLPENLDYFSKKVIIEGTKQASFEDDKYDEQRFEMDYVFAKSTMYQEKSTLPVESKWYHISRYPQWIGNTIYYWTMGLGFRPFRIIYWMLGTIILFALFYLIFFPTKINKYVFEDEDKPAQFTDTIINCLFFSFNLFFTFRLKREIVTFFEAGQKRLILVEWVLGFVSYIAFIALAKSGSILHSLKILFMG
ncbi:hypothetical protein GF337_03270 [candidate division KSB1 bacterium]|nr:hypothetical protein [candidate division KSB1 bacterium]